MKPVSGNTSGQPPGYPSSVDNNGGTQAADAPRKSRTRPPASVRVRERLRYETEQAQQATSPPSSVASAVHTKPSIGARANSEIAPAWLDEQVRRIVAGLKGDGLDQIEPALSRLREAGLRFDQPPLSKHFDRNFVHQAVYLAMQLTGNPFEVGSVAKRLIEMGCNPNVRDASGKTLLMYAARHGLADLVELLLHEASDALLRQLNSDGQNAAMIARSSENLAILRQLTDAGIELDPPNPALDYYADHLDDFRGDEGDRAREKLLRLLSENHYMNLADSEGWTLLFQAVLNEDVETVKLLCSQENKPDLNHRDRSQLTIFNYAMLIVEEDARNAIVTMLEALRSSKRSLHKMRKKIY